MSLGLKMSLQEHRRKLEKQHFSERWPAGFSWLPLQNIKLDGLSWPINFYIPLKGHEGLAAVVCKLHLRRCSDSLGGVQPEAWGGLLVKPAPRGQGCPGEKLAWPGGFWGQHSFCGQRPLWTDGTQVHASLMARLVSFPGVESRFGALWGSFQILDSAALGNLHFALISEPLTYGLEIGLMVVIGAVQYYKRNLWSDSPVSGEAQGHFQRSRRNKACFAESELCCM